MKLNTDVKVTFNPKSKVREINIATESAASQAHQLYCIDLFRALQREQRKISRDVCCLVLFKDSIKPKLKYLEFISMCC